MGPDGTPRTVASTTSGSAPRVRIEPVNGEPWVCSHRHVLTLVRSGTRDVIDIPVELWLQKHKTFKNTHKLFSAGVTAFKNQFHANTRPVDPYFLGVWFGDGSRSLRDNVNGRVLNTIKVSKPDSQILAVCKEQARRWGLHVGVNTSKGTRCPSYSLSADAAARGNGRWKPNPLLRAMRSMLGTELKMPAAYLHAPRSERLQFLAGLCDTDGELDRTMFTVVQKRKDWARAIWQLARSLGFYAYFRSRISRYRRSNGTYFTGTYWVVSISGDTHQIPTRISRKKAPRRRQIKTATRTGLSIMSVGKGACYGFTLRGHDDRFLLGDFTVTSARVAP